MNKNVKILIIAVAVILVVALVLAVINICVKKANKKAVEEENDSVISAAIKALSDSTYRDLELAGMIYTVGLTKSTFISDYFPETAAQALNSIVGGTASEELLKMVPDGLYGGKKLKEAVKGIEGKPSEKIKVKSLKVGDLLFVSSNGTAKNYIYDKDGLVDLSQATVKADTFAILDTLAQSDVFAIFRPSLIMDDYDYITEKSPKLDLTPEQEAVIVTAKSYLLRGEKLQYADTRLGSAIDSEFRWKAGFFSPEDYTSDYWGYTNCAAFTYDVYYNALGFDLHNNDKKLYTTYNYMNFSEDLGIRKYYMVCETAASYTMEDKERIQKEILETLQPADILIVRRDGNGHAMLYVGNGNIIHSGGSVYNYNESQEKYEASIRQMRLKDYFFTEGASGYIFGSDTGVKVSSFAIIRPLDIFEGEIPEVTQNRVKNMQGIMAQKLSSHNIAKTVNRGEEITFTFEVYNTNEKEVTLDICDTVPSHTTYVSGADEVKGDKISWKVIVPANSRKKVSYTVKVNEDAVWGGVIKSDDSTVGGVPVRCQAITVNRTLNGEEQAKILSAIAKAKANKTLKGFELVNEIYKNALGDQNIFADTDFNTVACSTLDGVFYGYGAVTENGLSNYKLNSEGKYRDMLVPTLYGGRKYISSSWSDRNRLAREHNLVVGDVLIRKTLENNQVYIYAGDGKFYDLTDGFTEDKLNAKRRLETTIATGNCYAILRPSFTLK